VKNGAILLFTKYTPAAGRRLWHSKHQQQQVATGMHEQDKFSSSEWEFLF